MALTSELSAGIPSVNRMGIALRRQDEICFVAHKGGWKTVRPAETDSLTRATIR